VSGFVVKFRRQNSWEAGHLSVAGIRFFSRNRQGFCGALLLAFCGLLYFSPASAQQGESRWVTDEFEITMRKGKDNRQAIIRMLPSGTRLELLESDREAGYSLVRTQRGTEGWVLNRYLLRSPPARVTLPDLEQRLRNSEEKRKELANQVRELTGEKSALKKTVGQLEGSGEGLASELDNLKRLSANVIKIDEQNKSLQLRLTENERILEELESENRRLSSRANREWFVIGGFVVMIGFVAGLIIPRIRWRRKSGWGEL